MKALVQLLHTKLASTKYPISRGTDRQTDRQKDRQTDRRTDGRTDRQTDKLNPISLRFTGDNYIFYVCQSLYVIMEKLFKANIESFQVLYDMPTKFIIQSIDIYKTRNGLHIGIAYLHYNPSLIITLNVKENIILKSLGFVRRCE